MSYIVHTGNCIKIMQGMEPESIDCVLTDPPYTGFDLSANTPSNYWEKFEPYYLEMDRLCNSSKRLSLSASQPRSQLISDKIGATDTFVINDAFEDKRGDDAFFISRNPVVDINNPEHLAYLTTNTLPASPVKKSSHPNARDIYQMSSIVKAMTNEGDTILDPFCGSAAIGIACILLGRHFIGIELLADRAEDARARLKDAERIFNQQS